MYLMWLLCILIQIFALSAENHRVNVLSIVSTTPLPLPSDQELLQIFTQLQTQNFKMQNTLDALEKIVNNRTCSARYDADFYFKLEKTLDDKIVSQNKHLEQLKSEVAAQNKHLEQVKSEVAAQNKHLEQVKSEVAAQNKYLEQVKNEVAAQNKYLEQVKNEVVSQNKQVKSEIVSQNKHLEDVKSEIAAQNKHLEQVESEVISQNQYLEQTKSEVLLQNKQVENAIVSQNKHLVQIKSEESAQNKQLEEMKSEVKQVGLDLEKIYDLLKKMNNIETTQKSTKYPKDCREIQSEGTTVSGIYKIKPKLSPEPFEVLCDMHTQGGGWVYVIKRFDGSQDFYLKWTDYKNGFGKLTGEFWLGLNHLYELTNSKNTELLIELEDWDGKIVYALYRNFFVGNEKESFKMKYLSGYSGNATDMMTVNLNDDFLAFDNPYTLTRYTPGSWWRRYTIGFYYGYWAQLTGKYFGKDKCVPFTGIHWISGRQCLRKAKMLIRPS